MTAREKIAEAICRVDPAAEGPFADYDEDDRNEWLAMADAAIAAHLDALKADGYVIAPAQLIEDLTDPDPCQWDHNHSCQAHGHFYIDQGELCPVEEAKRLIAAAEAQR